MWILSKGAVAAVLLVWVAAGTAVNPAKEKKKQKDEPGKPEVHLKVNPRHGFRPLTITLSGSLTGVSSGDQEFCHAGVEWESRTPMGVTTRSVEDPRCLHPPEQVKVEIAFTKILTLSRPGTYQYRLILHRRDGTRLLSNTQEIRVLSNY